MWRRHLAYAIAAGLLACSAVGPVTAQNEVTLVFRQNDTPLEAAGVKASVDVFNNENKRIKVRFETVPWRDARDQFIREAQAGGGPDVLQLAFVWTRDLARAGGLMNLDSFIKNSPPPNGIKDFVGLELGVNESSVYGIPWTVDTFAMVYRKDVFERAGIKRFPDTWEELQQVAAALSKPPNQYGFAFPAGSASGGGMWFLVNYYLWSNGYDVVRRNPGTGQWDVGIDEKILVETIQYFKAFFDKGTIPQSLIGVDSWADPVILRGLQQGTFAIGFMPPATLQAMLATDRTLPLMSAPIPRGRVRRISHLGGRTLAISRHTRYPAEAWEFLKYMASQRVFERYLKEQFPAQKSLLKEITFPAPFRGYQELLPQARTFYDYIVSPAPVGAMWDATNREFGAVYSGQKSAEQAARDLIAQIDGLVKQRK